MNTGNKYVLKALDNYPFYLEETMESLSYALSYDETNTMALCLMGRVYAEQLFDYERAKEYFQQALCQNVYAVEVYPYLIQLLVDTDEFEEAYKTIDFALTIKGIDKGAILAKKVILLETKGQLKKALKTWKEARQHTVQNDMFLELKNIEERIKQKLEVKQKNK